MESALATSNAGESKRFRVLLPLPLKPYDYRGGADIAPGDVVRVPLGRRHAIGVAWEIADPTAPDAAPAAKLKDIAAKLETPPLGRAHRRFIDWVAAYTLAPAGAVLRMTLSVPAALEPPALKVGYVAGGAPPARLTAARTKVVALSSDGVPRAKADLAAQAGVSEAVVQGLIVQGALVAVPLPADRGAVSAIDPTRPGPTLTAAQASAVAALTADVEAGRFHATLLEGVTGSGKTEVYFEAVAAALKRGRQCLVLVPEIALTAQWLDRFEARFGARPAEWHSELKASQRRRTWRAVAEGRATVVVGARSALFLPFADLGLIVVDEEQDGSYKQEDGIAYHARDMAVVRASLCDIPVVLVSATPSLETVANAEAGRYARLDLPARHGGATLPAVVSIDMRNERLPATRWISMPLAAALTETVAAGEQSMLFLNRRGYAPLTLCRTCGHRLACPNCSTWLVDHRLLSRLQCHHCGFTMPMPHACPSCQATESLAACGPGVERLADEVAALVPAARIAIVASDTVDSPSKVQALIEQIEQRAIDVIVGTQIVAKGHHFPLLTLVGVIDADLGLGGGDLRAAERTYQMLVQVAGRAGRAEHPGRVLVQTYDPTHPVIQALLAGDRAQFLKSEAVERERFHLPPFGRLAAVVVSSADERAAAASARALGQAAPRDIAGVRVLGPAPAPLALLRGRHRFRLLLMAERGIKVQPVLGAWLARHTPPARVRVQVDVDPYSFL
ncbi:MAG: primosomal protein N' [Alphaproteobacteria bacterium]|nr:primosomal protein N' [Alphaproteobacteria bacterium]